MDITQGKNIIAGLAQTANKIPAPQRKGVDVSQFQNLGNIPMNTVNSTPQMAPINLGSLGTITTPYGGSTNYEKFHPGIDIANKAGTPIPSLTGGTVTYETTGHKHGEKNYGNSVIVTDAQGNKFRYSHLAQAYVKAGQKIAPGTVIGGMGDTGMTYSNTPGRTGVHLDLRIVDAYGKSLNPMSFFKK